MTLPDITIKGRSVLKKRAVSAASEFFIVTTVQDELL